MTLNHNRSDSEFKDHSNDRQFKAGSKKGKREGGGGGGSGGVESRVGESDYGDRADPIARSLFGLRRKSPPEKFSGGGGRRRWVVAG
ncbi:hypothetical protein Tco_1429889 [Tanacetum coccineum]